MSTKLAAHELTIIMWQQCCQNFLSNLCKRKKKEIRTVDWGISPLQTTHIVTQVTSVTRKNISKRICHHLGLKSYKIVKSQITAQL